MWKESPAAQKYDAILTCSVAFLGLIALSISIYFSVKYSGQRILDQFAFRETQTALTAFWMIRDGFKLAYETPVVGAPWSIPFEFPIYQFIVAKVSEMGNFDLEKVGRLISYGFLLACLLPAFLISKRLFLSLWAMPFCIFACLFLSSPLYLYWGRSFMIETTALFFSLYFLYYSLALAQHDYRARNFIMAGVFLLLGLLQKSTTILPDLAVMGIVLLIASRRQIGFRSKVMWQAIAAYGIAFGIGFAWVKYSDYVKSKNFVGKLFTSDVMEHWNFGTLSLRLSKLFWSDPIWDRMFVQNAAGLLGLGVIALALYFAAPKIRIFVSGCLAVFLAHFLIFANLHFVHTYYQTSTGVFLIAAVAAAIYGLSTKFPALRFAVPIILLALVVSNLYWFKLVYLDSERQKYGDDSEQIAVGKLIQQKTAVGQPIIVYGYDWSSEIAFFSQRKAMSVADWFPKHYDYIDNSGSYLDNNPSAIVICGQSRTQELKDHILQKFKPTDTAEISNCELYFL